MLLCEDSKVVVVKKSDRFYHSSLFKINITMNVDTIINNSTNTINITITNQVTMTKNYDKQEYLRLLKKQSLNEQLNLEDSSKLRKYKIFLMKYFNWCIRQQYLDVLEKLQKGKIEPMAFCLRFEEINFAIENFVRVLESKLIIVSPHDTSLIFGDLLEEIFVQIDDLLLVRDSQTQVSLTDDDYELKLEKEIRDFELQEVELKESVRKTYLKIQDFLNKEGEVV